MAIGMAQDMKDSLEAQSYRVKAGVKELRDMLEEFQSPNLAKPTEGGDKAPPMDALSQISDNLTVTEQQCKTAIDLFEKIKRRIRA